MKSLMVTLFLITFVTQPTFAKKAKKRVPANQVNKIVLRVEAGHTVTEVTVTMDEKNHIEYINSNGEEVQGHISIESADFIIEKFKKLPINKKSKKCRGPIVIVSAEPKDSKDRSACLSYRNKITALYSDFANLLKLARDISTKTPQ